MAISTYQTYLYHGTTKEAMTKLVDIKEYPDMIGDPELLETTTLSDPAQTNILGVKAVDLLQFTANYTKEDFKRCNDLAEKDGFYELRFGPNGEHGVFEWEGQHTMGLPGGDVNAVVDMTVNIAASTPVVPKPETPAA
ncbi:phage tail protein [Eubacterium limosum]|uniref:phage tail protein n=1 Tax=Eubacterium limosum TaxID=1736 RepID=UPI0037237E63